MLNQVQNGQTLTLHRASHVFQVFCGHRTFSFILGRCKWNEGVAICNYTTSCHKILDTGPTQIMPPLFDTFQCKLCLYVVYVQYIAVMECKQVYFLQGTRYLYLIISILCNFTSTLVHLRDKYCNIYDISAILKYFFLLSNQIRLLEVFGDNVFCSNIYHRHISIDYMIQCVSTTSFFTG